LSSIFNKLNTFTIIYIYIGVIYSISINTICSKI